MAKTTISLDDPVMQKAIALAEVFSRHCKENNLPDTLVITGVAHNSSAVEEKAYIKGKLYEKDRLVTFLGLNSY